MDAKEQETGAHTQARTSIWSRSFIILFFANMAFNMGMNMNSALLALFADHLGASAATVGFVVSSFGITAIVFRLIAAPIMDTYNRKYLVIFAALTVSASFLGLSVSTSIPMLVGFRMLQGCGMAFGNACCLAMVADMLPKERYTSGLGYYSLAQVVCSAIAPTVGIELLNRTSFRATYTIAACLMLLAAVLICLIKTSFSRTKKLKLSINNMVAKEAFFPASLQFMTSCAIASLSAFLFLYAAEQSVTGNVGLYFTVTAVTMLATRPVTGRLVDKYGLIRVSVPALLCSIISVFVISGSKTLAGFLIAAFIAAFGQGTLGPAVQALSMKAVSTQRRGAASSTNYIALDAGALLGPFVAGHIVQIAGYVPMWRIMTIPYAVCAAALILFRGVITRIEKNFAD